MEFEDVVVAWDVEKTGRSRQYPVCAVGACCLRWQHHKGRSGGVMVCLLNRSSGPSSIEILETEAWPIRVPLEHFEQEALQQFWGEPSQRQVLEWIDRYGESERDVAHKIHQFHERMQTMYLPRDRRRMCLTLQVSQLSSR